MIASSLPGFPRLLTPGETAAALKRNPKTLARWAAERKIRIIWTPGGTRRYVAEDVEALAAEAGQ